jgi:hypothetical protein
MGLNASKQSGISSWLSRRLPGFSLRGVLWIVVVFVLLLSYLLYNPESAAEGAQPCPADWILRSWPALLATATAMWLLLQGPVANMQPFVQKGCRLVMVFFAYAGFLYLLKWNPFWKWMPWLGFKDRNKTEGFLILVSTLIWFVASLRTLFRGLLRLPVLFGSRALTTRSPRQEKTRSSLTLKNLAIFYYFFTRK